MTLSEPFPTPCWKGLAWLLQFHTFLNLLCWSKGPETPPLFRAGPGGAWSLPLCLPSGSCKGSHQMPQTPVTLRGEQGTSGMPPAPHTCWKSGYYPLHVMQWVPSPHCQGLPHVPVLLLNPPGKGKGTPSSHHVQGSQQSWQAGRAGPKEIKLDF